MSSEVTGRNYGYYGESSWKEFKHFFEHRCCPSVIFFPPSLCSQLGAGSLPCASKIAETNIVNAAMRYCPMPVSPWTSCIGSRGTTLTKGIVAPDWRSMSSTQVSMLDWYRWACGRFAVVERRGVWNVRYGTWPLNCGTLIRLSIGHVSRPLCSREWSLVNDCIVAGTIWNPSMRERPPFR